jgi:hypothetical protein
MQSRAQQTGIQRVVTGNRCEVQGCYEMALWLVSYRDDTSHLCAKHTRSAMRSPNFSQEQLALGIEP